MKQGDDKMYTGGRIFMVCFLLFIAVVVAIKLHWIP